MDYKKPLTVDEQVAYLEETKRVVFTNISKDKAKDILLTEKYINVVTPYKYVFAKKDSTGKEIRDTDNAHIYESDVEFSEYYDHYVNEIKKYPRMFKNISRFERTFNAIVSYILLCAYDIHDDQTINNFVNSLLTNVSTIKEKPDTIIHMTESINTFADEIRNYKSPFIFFDRLSLSSLIAVYKCSGTYKKDIFKELLNHKATLGVPDMDSFDKLLRIIVPIRNYVYHNNSLTVLIRYYDFKTKDLRHHNDQKKFIKVIKRLQS